MGRHFEVRAAAMAASAKAKSAIYMRASKEIYAAAKSGEPDPNSNLALRSAIEKYRKSCPKDVIERAIEKAKGGDTVAYINGRYEFMGPGGSNIIVDTLTDNVNRALVTVRTIVTRKGGNQTILYFPESVADALQAYLKERMQVEPVEGYENALFLSLQRRRITQRAVENLVKKYAMIAAPLKKKISPHKLRSTFGTSLYQETGDIYLVADVLGHADVNTTRKHYAAMSDMRKREAAKRVVLPTSNHEESQEEKEE